MSDRRGVGFGLLVAVASVLLVVSCGERGGSAGEVVVYCGRSRELVGPVLEAFERETGVRVRVRYGRSAELAVLLTTEGDRSPAHVFLAQDAGALGAVADAGRLRALPGVVLDRVAPAHRDLEGRWVGLTGRERVLAINTDRVAESAVPGSLLELTGPAWRGRVGWAPTNGSFQAHVTVMRSRLGEERTEDWLRGMAANGAVEYSSNSEIVRAVADGRVDVGLVNDYYVPRLLDELGVMVPVRAHSIDADDPTAMTNVSGIGLVEGRAIRAPGREAAALALVSYLLDEPSQAFFRDQTYETPLAKGVEGAPAGGSAEDGGLSGLADLRETLEMLRRTGVLP